MQRNRQATPCVDVGYAIESVAIYVCVMLFCSRGEDDTYVGMRGGAADEADGIEISRAMQCKDKLH